MVTELFPRPVALSLLAFALAGCMSAPADLPSRHDHAAALDAAPLRVVEVTADTVARHGAPAGDAIYRIGVGDVVQIHAPEAPELTAAAGYQVGADGALHLPYLGAVPAEGRSAAELRADLIRRLRAYFPAPQVDVRVTGFNARAASVVGAVNRPSRQPLTDRSLTAIDAVHAAGGFALPPERAALVLVRGGSEQPLDLAGFLSAGTPLPALRDGDVLRVERASRRNSVPDSAPETVRLTLPGAAPRSVALGQGPVTLMQLTAAYAPGRSAPVSVQRMGSAGPVAYRFSAGNAGNPQIAGRFHLRAGDIVTVLPVNAPISARLSTDG